VRLLPADAEPQRRLGLLVEAASALTSGGAYEESLTALEGALALVPRDRPQERAEVIAKLAYAKRRGGRPFDSPAVLENALEELGAGHGPVAADLRLELAVHRFWHDELAALSELAGQLLLVAREGTDLAMVSLALALSSLASAEHSVAQALAELSEARVAFASLSDEQLAERIYVSFYLGLAELRVERADDAFAHANRGLEVARMTGQALTVTPWPAIASRALLLKGQVGEAARLAHTAIDSALLAADDWRTVWALESDALMAFWAGDNDRALASSREMVARSQRAHGFLSGPAQVQLAGAEYATGDPASAADRLSALDTDSTRRMLDLHAAHGWELLTRATLALGEADHALHVVRRAARRADATGLPQRLATVRIAHATVLLARGEIREASRLLSDAMAYAEAAGNPLPGARARALGGIALAAAGEHARGIAELEHAERVLFTCGASREADLAARELRRLGRRVPRRARAHGPPGLAMLTPREREVAAQVASGRTNREVAVALLLSEKTIESHLARIYEKVGVHSRAALAALIGREAGARDPHEGLVPH
jgi:DNA-binding CsgD family transcriptional regulator